MSYHNLYESRAKNSWFAHVVQETSPHDDVQLSKIRRFVAVNAQYTQAGTKQMH